MAEAMDSGAPPPPPSPSSSSEGKLCADMSSLSLEEKPTCIICLGMAGSGKTTFVQVKRASQLADCPTQETCVLSVCVGCVLAVVCVFVV